MKKNKNIDIRLLFFFTFSFLCAGNHCMAQQVLGANPNIDAGFENQSAGNLTATNPPVSTAFWSFVSSGNNQNRLISSSGGYGGPKFLSAGKTNPTTNTSTTINSNIVSTNSFLASTKYIIQFFYKQNTGIPDPASFVFISADGTSPNRVSTPISLGTPSVWTKYVTTVTTAATIQTTSGTTGINIKITGLADGTNTAVVDVDNFVVYPADNQTTPVQDNTAPESPLSGTVINSGTAFINLNWDPPAGGIDGGGYLVVRYTSDPTGEPAPLANAVYATNNTIGSGTVVYIGSSASFNNTGLSTNSTYYYSVYTVDKAFNYSEPIIVSGTTSIVAARNYYINQTEGNDTNPGTLALPWKNLTRINGENILPGSTIFLKAGEVWTGQRLKFSGSGTVSNLIKIDQYGAAAGIAKPLLAGNGITGEGVVYLYNQSYIEINNLEITNAPNGPINSDFFVGINNGVTNNNPLGADRRGVMVAIDNYGTANHIYCKNLDIHHIKGQLGNGSTTVNGAIPKRTGGIYFAVLDLLEQTSTNSRFNDILIDSCTIAYCENIGLAFDNEWNVYYPGGALSSITADVTEYNNWYRRRFTNITIRNNVIHHIGKNAMIIRCTDETGLIERNLCYETAVGTTGNTMFTARAKGTIFQYNEGYYNRSTTQNVDPGNIDGSLYDADFGSVGIIFQYSYSHQNSEGLYWGCNTRGGANNTSGIPDPGDIGCTVRYNISQNDFGDKIFFNYPSAGNEVYNNVFYISAGSRGNIIHENSGNNHTYNFYNNIIYNNSTTEKYAFGSGTGIQNRTISNNIFYGQHPLTEPEDPFKLISDPLFVNPGAGATGLTTVTGYKLNTGSPAIGSGKVVNNNGGYDYFGNIIPTLLAPNRGVFEGTGIVLPVWLFNFKVSKQQNAALLLWSTSTEQNSSHFDIERSIDGSHFIKVGSVSAAGNASHLKSYQFKDLEPVTGRNYYRLCSIDFNGEKKYSAIQWLDFSGKLSLYIYPNPAKEMLTLKSSLSLSIPVLAEVLDASGHFIQSFKGNLESPIHIPVSGLANGIYFLKVLELSTFKILDCPFFIKTN